MQRLQYDGVPAREQRRHLVVPYLIGDLRTHTSRSGELTVAHDRTVLRDTQERRPQTATGQQLVHSLQAEQIVVRRRQIRTVGQQRPRTPIGVGELV